MVILYFHHEFESNVHTQAVDAALEEARFEERVGGSFADRADDKLFRWTVEVLKGAVLIKLPFY